MPAGYPIARVSDASLRPLMHDFDAVTWESSDPAIVGPTPTIGGTTLFTGLAPGETTMTGRYGELEVTVEVRVVTPEP